MSVPHQNALRSLSRKVSKKQFIIKSADKGDVTVLMNHSFYHQMCMNELNKNNFYRKLGTTNRSKTALAEVINFANTYRAKLTTKEYEFLTNSKYSMANFYSLPKLHKSE